MEVNMPISVTETAAQQIRNKLQKRGSGIGLRLGVKASGCSGYTYVMDFAEEMAMDDLVFEQYGVKVLIKAEHMDLLNEIELDYAKEGLSESFKFNNPKVKATCGCGESFAV
jgi:iron-sulfur cluster assembly protein